MINTSHLNKVSSEAEILAEWIGRMQQENLTPDGVTFTTLMQVLFFFFAGWKRKHQWFNMC